METALETTLIPSRANLPYRTLFRRQAWLHPLRQSRRRS